MTILPAFNVVPGQPKRPGWRIAAVVFALIIFGQARPLDVAAMRGEVIDLAIPFFVVTEDMTNWIATRLSDLAVLFNLKERYDRLESENAALKRALREAQKLADENHRMRALFNFVPNAARQVITARSISDGGSSFRRGHIIFAGMSHGLAKGQAVMVNGALIGRLIWVGSRSSWAMLVADSSSRIPVFVGSQRVPAILAGDHAKNPRLIYIDQKDVKPGDRVVTSGHGGALPAGLAIGSLLEEPWDRVRLDIDPRRSTMVQIIDFGLVNPFDDSIQAITADIRP